MFTFIIYIISFHTTPTTATCIISYSPSKIAQSDYNEVNNQSSVYLLDIRGRPLKFAHKSCAKFK